jgi:glycosyltransferase involved in cell wall biosynthesis
MSVCVAVTTRNRAHLLDKCLSSILCQSRAPDAVIVSDDASSDDTPVLMAGFHERFATRGIDLRYHHHETPMGQEANRRYALTQCRSDLVAFLDDDDFWECDFLHATTAVMASNPELDLVATGMTIVDDAGQPLPDVTVRADLEAARNTLVPGMQGDWLPQHLQGPQFLLGNVLFRHAALQAIGLVPAHSGIICDFAIFCALASNGARAFWLPMRLFNYRIHGHGRASDQTIQLPAALADWTYRFAKTLSRKSHRELMMRTSMRTHRAVALLYASRRDVWHALQAFATLIMRHGPAGVDWREFALSLLMLSGLERRVRLVLPQRRGRAQDI